MGIRVVITLLCGVGLYASLFMLAKSRRAAKGRLEEPSVVQTPRARLFFGTPNAAFGTAYYPLMAVSIWALPMPPIASVAVAAVAAAVSVYLAYSLLFVTRMPCPFCWTAHGINWSLLLLLLLSLHR